MTGSTAGGSATWVLYYPGAVCTSENFTKVEESSANFTIDTQGLYMLCYQRSGGSDSVMQSMNGLRLIVAGGDAATALTEPESETTSEGAAAVSAAALAALEGEDPGTTVVVEAENYTVAAAVLATPDDNQSLILNSTDGTAVELPTSVIAQLEALGNRSVLVLTTYTAGETIGVTMIDTALEDARMTTAPVSVEIYVTEASNDELFSGTFVEPILVTVNATRASGAICAYIDEDTGEWRTDGVSAVDDPGGAFVCSTDHLTIFGTLLEDFGSVFFCSSASLIAKEGFHCLGKEPWWFSPGFLFIVGIIVLYSVVVGVAQRRAAQRMDAQALKGWSQRCLLPSAAPVPGQGSIPSSPVNSSRDAGTAQTVKARLLRKSMGVLEMQAARLELAARMNGSGVLMRDLVAISKSGRRHSSRWAPEMQEWVNTLPSDQGCVLTGSKARQDHSKKDAADGSVLVTPPRRRNVRLQLHEEPGGPRVGAHGENALRVHAQRDLLQRRLRGRGRRRALQPAAFLAGDPKGPRDVLPVRAGHTDGRHRPPPARRAPLLLREGHVQGGGEAHSVPLVALGCPADDSPGHPLHLLPVFHPALCCEREARLANGVGVEHLLLDCAGVYCDAVDQGVYICCHCSGGVAPHEGLWFCVRRERCTDPGTGDDRGGGEK
eukprot:NODE_145_length_3530_cov_2.194534.p1 GENE.NODE_145_length_3530_cov_2.194534~~NODE_145_length_3530_cov_2.194534.p1  ORF type:complete len:778 (+),score=116.66 NODE_145_length_3530_cov_2.194534:346-2334(+)